MFKVMKQVTDGGGTRRWEQHGVEVFGSVERAAKAVRRAAMASLSTGHREGYRSTRFRIAPALAAVACLILQ